MFLKMLEMNFLRGITTSKDSVAIIGYTGNGGDVVIPSEIDSKSVTSIGEYAFYGCTGLTSVTIPDGVTLIGKSAFSDCTGLTAISVDKNNKSYTSEDGVLFDKNKTTLIAYPEGKKGAYTIPYGVKSISDAFAGCTGLTNVTIPDSVTEIGDEAFYGCTRLASITIPDSVTEIGRYAFFRCKRLTSVTIPDSVTSIGNRTFCICTGLTSINVDKNNKSYISEDGVLFDKNKTTLIAYPEGKKGDYTIPNTVTLIDKDAFAGCTGLTNVTIPDSIKSIGNEAFSDCKRLTSVTIPDSVTSIGNLAFSDCKRLTNVIIPDSVVHISKYSFFRCKKITIKGYEGSYAETYCKIHNLKFKKLVERNRRNLINNK